MIKRHFSTPQQGHLIKVDSKGLEYPRIKLKGGSLSETTLHMPPDGISFVRKQVSIKTNREYGFQRWYSQLKRLQRYEYMYPMRYPKILGYGYSAEIAYFDIEYIEASTNVYEFLKHSKNTEEVSLLFARLMSAMDDIHKVTLPSFEEALPLYLHEEIEQKFYDCMGSNNFRLMIAQKYIYFQGKRVQGIYDRLDEYTSLFIRCYKDPIENFSHGNMTLENILYQQKTGRIVFIDPYEENIIDSKLADYSQIMQSCDAYYEFYNEIKTIWQDNRLTSETILIPEGLMHFRTLFLNFLERQLNAQQLLVVRMLQVSQFIRMLPFKMVKDENKMMFFYGLASYTFERIVLDLKNHEY
jgi:hypothetical protein